MSLTSSHEQFVREISVKMQKSSINDMPKYIAALRERVEAAQFNTESSIIRNIIVSYNFLEVFPLMLGHDYPNLHGKWKMLEKLVDFSIFCSEWPASDTQLEQYEGLIPPIYSEIVNLVGKILIEMNSFPSGSLRQKNLIETCKHFLRKLNIPEKAVCSDVLHSQNTVEVLTSVINDSLYPDCLELIRSIYLMKHKPNTEALNLLGSYFLSILTVTDFTETAKLAFDCLLRILRTPAGKFVKEQQLLSCLERWEGHGIDDELRAVVGLYEGKVNISHKMRRFSALAREEEAATLIQSTWRGFKCRQRLARLTQLVVMIQRRFREKMEKKRRDKKGQQIKQIVDLNRTLRGISKSRTFHENELKRIQQISAVSLNSYKHNSRVLAAITIQRWWRSHLSNKKTPRKLSEKIRAACTIQRALRKWIQRKKHNKMYEGLIQVEKVDKETHTKLIETLMYRKTFKKEELKDDSIELLKKYILRRRAQTTLIDNFERLSRSIDLTYREISETPPLDQMTNPGRSSLNTVRIIAEQQHKQALLSNKIFADNNYNDDIFDC